MKTFDEEVRKIHRFIVIRKLLIVANIVLILLIVKNCHAYYNPGMSILDVEDSMEYTVCAIDHECHMAVLKADYLDDKGYYFFMPTNSPENCYSKEARDAIISCRRSITYDRTI